MKEETGTEVLACARIWLRLCLWIKKKITLLIELHLPVYEAVYPIMWCWQIQVTYLSLIFTSSGHCMILYMTVELSHLLLEVQEIKFPHDRSYFRLCYQYSL